MTSTVLGVDAQEDNTCRDNETSSYCTGVLSWKCVRVFVYRKHNHALFQCGQSTAAQ